MEPSIRISFCGANCLLDPSSGAAIEVRTILELLAHQGAVCSSFTASTFDAGFSADAAESLTFLGVSGPDTRGFWSKNEGGVAHTISLASSTHRAGLSPDFERRLLADGIAFLEAQRPDAILIYGDGIFERGIASAARARGVATLFYLANPSYQSRATFEQIDQVLTDTEATRALYEQRLQLSSIAIGKFISPPRIPEGLGTPEFVTFVNPSLEKGVTLFYRIVELARSVVPDVRFLVVESRATLEQSERRAGMRFSAFPSIRRIGLQKNMNAVLGLTKILLMPSLWHESGGRMALEAMSLGIPAIVSDRGGLPEVVGDAAIKIAPPEPLTQRHYLIPPLSEAIPWVEAIRQLTTDAEYYRERANAGRERWKAHDPTFRTRELIDLVRGLTTVPILP